MEILGLQTAEIHKLFLLMEVYGYLFGVLWLPQSCVHTLLCMYSTIGQIPFLSSIDGSHLAADNKSSNHNCMGSQILGRSVKKIIILA